MVKLKFIDQLHNLFALGMQFWTMELTIVTSETLWMVQGKKYLFLTKFDHLVLLSLSATAGFSEETRNSVCTQYTSRDCDRF